MARSTPSSQTWSSPNDIQANPNTPFREPPIQVLVTPLTPLQEHYNDVRSRLKYAREAEKHTLDRGEVLLKELEAASVRLSEKGGEGRDGRERWRKVVVLEKLLVVHEEYLGNLEECRGKLEKIVNGLNGELKEKGFLVEEGISDTISTRSRGWWFDAAVADCMDLIQ